MGLPGLSVSVFDGDKGVLKKCLPIAHIFSTQMELYKQVLVHMENVLNVAEAILWN